MIDPVSINKESDHGDAFQMCNTYVHVSVNIHTHIRARAYMHTQKIEMEEHRQSSGEDKSSLCSHKGLGPSAEARGAFCPGGCEFSRASGVGSR